MTTKKKGRTPPKAPETSQDLPSNEPEIQVIQVYDTPPKYHASKDPDVQATARMIYSLRFQRVHDISNLNNTPVPTATVLEEFDKIVNEIVEARNG